MIRRTSTGAMLIALALWFVAGFHGVAVAQENDEAWQNVVVELRAPSAVEVYLAAVAAAGDAPTAADAQQIAAVTATQVAEVASAQELFAASLSQYGGEEIYRVQRVYNGIAMRLPLEAIEALRSDPRVRAIYPLVAKTPDNAVAVAHSGVPYVWDIPEGLTGKGIRIGIIDTGVDYLHVGLGGPGTGYDENDTTIIGDVTGFPNARVVGGYDFVGDTYNANPAINPYQPVPQPDPDPMDCYNHGTHVAGTAAGTGVTSAGAAFSGEYTSDLDFSSFRIAPGVAPEAEIYALKVFGCVGSSEVVDLAIEWAIDPNGDGDFSDRLDVLNLSLGSPFGDVDDISTLAIERAVQAGILVAASMGNTGDVFYSAGSPGVATRAVTVAATQVTPSDLVTNGSQSDLIATFSARGPRRGDNLLKPDISAPGYLITSVGGGTGNGATTLSGTSMATPLIGGSLALLRQLYPLWTTEEIKALLMSTSMGAVRFDPGYTGLLAAPSRAGTGALALDDAVRSDVVAYSPDTPGAVSLNFGSPELLGDYNALRNLRIVNHSGETRTLIAEYIPVLDVPGVDISFSGSSTITVPASGSSVLPVLLTAQASAFKNVRDPSLATTQAGMDRQWRSEEQGHVWLWDSRGIFTATLTGGDATPPSANTATATVTAVYSPTTRVLSYTLQSAIAPNQVTSVNIDRGISGNSRPQETHTLYVAGGSEIVFPLTGTATLSQRDAVLLASGYLQVRIGASSGTIAGTLTADKPVLKTALYAAPRPASAIQAVTQTLDVGDATTVSRSILLTGTELSGTNFPTDTQSLVSVFELHASSARLSNADDIATPASADLQYIGVTSDYHRVASKNDARMYFAISTWGEWSTPWQTQFVVHVDVDKDGVSDYRVYTTDMASYQNSRQYSDAFVVAVMDQNAGGTKLGDAINLLSRNEQLTAIFQNNVLFVSLPASAIGLSSSKGDFNFKVETLLRSPRPGEYGESVGWLTYDMRRQGLAISNMTAGSPYFLDRPGTSIGVTYNLTNVANSTVKGLLLLHHFNHADRRAETIGLIYRWPFETFFPLVAGE